MKRHIIFLVIILTSIIGCEKNINPQSDKPTPPVIEPPIVKPEKKIPIKISSTLTTKVTDVAYETGDKVGIYTVNYVGDKPGTLVESGNHLDNISFTFNGTTWTAANQTYWKDDTTPADFYCYYPYTASISNIHAVPFAVKSDQSQIENYKTSEFLYGKTAKAKPSESAVLITTKHLMSCLIINLKPGKGYTNESLNAEKISITITGLQTNGTIDLNTGVATASGTPMDIIPYKTNSTQWKVLLMPQRITDLKFIQVKVGDYTYSMKQTMTFKSNFQHKCTLTVDKLSDGVNIGIDGWESDGNDYGGVLE